MVAFFVTLGCVNPIYANDLVKVNTKVESSKSEGIKTGIYSIDTKINGLSLEMTNSDQTGNQVILAEKDKKESQYWYVSKVGNGKYSIISVISGKALGISYKKDLTKAHFVMTEYNGSVNQKWLIKKVEEGVYTITSCVSDDFVIQAGNQMLTVSRGNNNIYQSFKFEYIRNIIDEDKLESSVESVNVSKKSTEQGSFTVEIDGPESNAIVSSAIIKVYPEKNKKKAQTFYVPKNEEGNFVKVIRSSDFEYESGTYVVNLKLLLDGVIVSEIGDYKCKVADTFKMLETNVQELIGANPTQNQVWQISYRDLSHKKEFDYECQKSPSAGMIKMFIMAAAYDNYDEICKSYAKEVVDNTLLNMVALDRNDCMGSVYSFLGEGDFDKGAEAVTEWAKENGYTDVEASTIFDQNFCSAKDASQFLVDLYNKKYKHSEAMLNILSKQAIKNLIPGVIPADVKTANKTGVYGFSVNDSAIVYSPNGDYVLTIMSDGIRSLNQAQQLVRLISQDVYKFLNE